MTEATRTMPIPRGPHPDTLKDPRHTILDASGTRLLCWCPRHRCGAIYAIEADIWNMQVPLSFAEFLDALRSRGLVVDDSPDLVAWIEACSSTDLPSAMAPGGNC